MKEIVLKDWLLDATRAVFNLEWWNQNQTNNLQIRLLSKSQASVKTKPKEFFYYFPRLIENRNNSYL